MKPPDKGVIAPLVKWGQAAFGPYTWPGSATQAFGVGAALVSLPPANARRRTACSCVDVDIGADDVYQTCGLGRADNVGSNAPISCGPR